MDWQVFGNRKLTWDDKQALFEFMVNAMIHARNCQADNLDVEAYAEEQVRQLEQDRNF